MADPSALPQARDLSGIADGVVHLLGKREIQFSDGTTAGATIAVCNVPALYFVTEVVMEVVTALDGTTAGTDGWQIGDGDDVNGYITVQTAVDMYSSKNTGAGVYEAGKHYATADTVDAEYEVASDSSEGESRVYVFACSDDKDTGVIIA